MREKVLDYVYIEEDILKDRKIDPKAKLLYIYIRRQCDICGGSFAASMDNIADALNIKSRKTVSGLMKQLADAKYLEVKRGGMNRQNTYSCRSSTERRIKADIREMSGLSTVYDKLVYLITANAEHPLSKEDITNIYGIKPSSLKKALYALEENNLISPVQEQGRKLLYWVNNRNNTESTGPAFREAVEEWLGKNYFTRNTGFFAEAAVMIRDAIIRDRNIKDKKDRELFELYCRKENCIDPEKVISAFIRTDDCPNCSVFLRRNSGNENMRAFRFSEQGSGAKTDNEDKSLHDTEFNYFYGHEKIMLYAVTAESCKEHCIMVNASADNESFRVKTNGVILEAGSLYRIFLKCRRDADRDYQLIYAEECRAETARLAGIEKGYRHKDNEFCVAVSSLIKKQNRNKA